MHMAFYARNPHPMKVSYTLLLICALEASFWLGSVSAQEVNNEVVGDELANRWSQNIATEPAPECLSDSNHGASGDAAPQPEYPDPTPTQLNPEKVARVPRAGSNDRRCNTNTGEALLESDGAPEKTPKKGKPSEGNEKNWGFLAWLLAALISSVLAIIIFGHGLANVPLSKLGANGGAGFSTLVWGYDGSRGEFSLVGCACIFAPFVGPLVYLVGCWGTAGLLLLLALWYCCSGHASHPGGPRLHAEPKPKPKSIPQPYPRGYPSSTKYLTLTPTLNRPNPQRPQP